MKKKIVLFIMMFSLLFTACGGRDTTTDTVNPSYETGDATVTEAARAEPNEDAPNIVDIGVVDPSRMVEILYTLNLETKDFQASSSSLIQLVSKEGGYIAASNVYTSPSYEKDLYTGEYTIKVPRDNVMAFIEGLTDNVGTVLEQNTQTVDHTDAYKNNEIRLSSERSKLEALNALYERADTIEDIMAIQAQIIETQTTIDSLEGAQQTIETSVEYSTVTVYLREVFEITEADSRDPSFGSRIGAAIKNSWRNVVDFFQNTVIALIYLVPLLLIFATIAFVVYLLWKRFGKKATSNWRTNQVKRDIREKKIEGKKESL